MPPESHFLPHDPLKSTSPPSGLFFISHNKLFTPVQNSKLFPKEKESAKYVEQKKEYLLNIASIVDALELCSTGRNLKQTTATENERWKDDERERWDRRGF